MGGDGWGALGRWRRRRRMTRLLAELDRIDRAQETSSVQLAQRSARRERLRSVVSVLAVVALLVVAWQVNGRLRAPSGGGSSDLAARIPASGPVGHGLSRPEQVDVGDGAYRFSLVHPDGTPVAYPSCRPVELVVNPDGGPPGADDLVSEAAAAVSEASGLSVEVVGESDDRPSGERQLVPEGADWPPSLVAWSDPEESPQLEGAVAGYAGSGWVQRGADTVYVSGGATFDAPQFEALLSGGGWDAARGIVVHELAHLLGLGHVDDPTQLMYPQAQRDVTTLQDGDRAGLAALGEGICLEP